MFIYLAAVLAQIDPSLWAGIQQVAMILAALLAGGFVVPVVNQLKGMLNWSGYAAFALSAVVAIVFGIAVAVAEGTITGDSFSWGNLFELFTAVFVAAQAVYQMLEAKKEAQI